ncbi:hypothetical protein [Kitasatospora sp. NPDC087315]|uniref:hypothetical protein n=1 Tax=Kitasatospora sp. NPDC087315 TaxID=3364069 RepID=UPI0038271A6F
MISPGGLATNPGSCPPICCPLDAVERALVVEAEPVGVEEDRLQFVEGVGLGSEADAVALHGLDEGLDDLVVEGAHPATAEGGVEVVFEKRVEVVSPISSYSGPEGVGVPVLAGIGKSGIRVGWHQTAGPWSGACGVLCC